MSWSRVKSWFQKVRPEERTETMKLTFTADVRARIETLRLLGNHRSYGAFFKHALALYERALKNQLAGGRLVLVDKDGNQTHMTL